MSAGEGSTFELYFPAVAAARIKQAAQPAGRTVTARSGRRVLYVDDEDALVRLGVRHLERHGYDVTGCTDARHALEVFRADPTAFDAVVTDMSMPAMSGYELTSALLALRPDVPVSGYMPDSEQDAARRLGVRLLITKPDVFDSLTRALGELLRTDMRA